MILKILEKIFSGFLEGDHHHFHLLSWLLSLKSTILRLVRQFWSWQRSSLASWKEIFPIMILIFTFHPQNHQYCGYTFLDKGGQGAWWLERQAFQVNNELITKVQNSEYVLHLLSNVSSDSGRHTVTICLVCSFNQTLSWEDTLWQSVTVSDNLWLSVTICDNQSHVIRLLVGKTHCDYLHTALPFAIINLAELERYSKIFMFN